jgi:hypothetical protein
VEVVAVTVSVVVATIDTQGASVLPCTIFISTHTMRRGRTANPAQLRSRFTLWLFVKTLCKCDVVRLLSSTRPSQLTYTILNQDRSRLLRMYVLWSLIVWPVDLTALQTQSSWSS